MVMRKLLNEALVNALGNGSARKKVAISFSGGTDSLCILFSMLELGFRPVLYTYHVAGFASDDLKRARMMSAAYKLRLVECPIPCYVDAVLQTVRQMILDGIRGKVCLQCMHGHYMVAHALKERTIINGSGVDGLYGTYRQEIIDGHSGRMSKADFDARRQKHLDKANDDAMEDQTRCYHDYARATVVYPYRHPAIVCYLMALNWKEINEPRLKWVTVQDYPEFKLHKHLWRPRGSQQIVAGTRTLHDILLDPAVNVKKRKTVMQVYKDLEAAL